MIDTQEFELADLHLGPSAQAAVPPGQTPPQNGEALAVSISLPAALCDEELISEIQSIPDKMGFKIGEVAEMLEIKQYVLRYWESEFEVLKPKKATNNQRYYTRKDVENAYLIRKLLHRDRFSIEGARAAIRDLKSFVKQEVKKEKEWTQVHAKFDQVQDQVDRLILDIRKIKVLFR
ncbi:MAG: MerR family transcriptional regulator [Pseudobdellovibrionaceae bacterium]